MNDPEETNQEPVKVRQLMKPKKQRKLAARERRERKTRGRRILAKLGVFVGVPTLVAAVYFSFLASDIYESTAVVMIQTAGGIAEEIKENVVKRERAGSAKDADAIKEYILSRDMLALLEQEHQVAAHFSQPQADWWSRLATSPTSEETYAYYLKKVDVSFGDNPSVLKLKVRAYSPEMARSMAQAIITLAEQKVNTLSNRLREDQVELAQQQLEHAGRRLTEAQKTLLKLQDEQPDAAAASTATGDSQLTARARLEAALLERSLAEKSYQAATNSLDAVTMAATRQSRYFVTIASPSTPDTPTRPKRFFGVLTVFCAAIAAFGILSLLIAAVREHARV